MLNALIFLCFSLFMFALYNAHYSISVSQLVNNNVILVSVNNTEESENDSKPTVSLKPIVPSDVHLPSDIYTLTKGNSSGSQSQLSYSVSVQPVFKLKHLAAPVFNKDGEYVFQEQLGVYCDSFEITHYNFVKSAFLVVGQSKQILLSVLSEETDWNATKPIDRGSEWQDRYSLIVKHYQKEWIHSETNRTIKSPDSNSSRLSLNTFPGMNAPFIVGENFCYQRRQNRWIYFSKRTLWSKNVTTRNWFRWGWIIDRNSEYPPNEKLVFINESVYVSQPFLRRHITHFAESVNQILIKFEYPSFYPKLTTLFLPHFIKRSEYEWSKEYLQLLLSHIPESQQPVVYTNDNNPFIPKDWKIEFVCFRNVVFLDRLAYNKDGGVFGGFFSQDLMRSRAYKYAGISGKRESFKDGVPVMFLDRRDSRSFRKVDIYKASIKKYFGNKVKLFYTTLSSVSFKKQIELFSSYPIVIGGHGSAMANMMFAIPHSVLIECNPPYFYEMCFANIAFISRVHYISVTNYNGSYIQSGNRKAIEAYNRGGFFAIRRDYAFHPIYPNVFHVIAAIDDALEYVERYQYAYQVNDFWSFVYN